MVEQKASEVAELLDGEVSAPHGLHPFLTSDPDAYMGRADHAHIVRSVPTASMKTHSRSSVTDGGLLLSRLTHTRRG